MAQDDNAKQGDKPAPTPITLNPLDRPFNDRPLGHVTRNNEGHEHEKRIELNNPPPARPCSPAKDDD